MNHFEFINSINTSKQDIMVDDITEKAYSSFMVNRGLSFFPDTVLLANEMNINHHLDNKLQYHFLMNTVSKKRRFSKWAKSHKIESIEIIKQYYGCSDQKAKSILLLLTNEQINELKLRMNTGGKN
jgi:hypothetical protein